MASAPRSTMPPTAAPDRSILRRAALALRPLSVSATAAAAASKTRSTVSSTSLSSGSSVTTQFCPTVAETVPGDVQAIHRRGVSTSKLASKRGRSRRPATSRHGRARACIGGQDRNAGRFRQYPQPRREHATAAARIRGISVVKFAASDYASDALTHGDGPGSGKTISPRNNAPSSWALELPQRGPRIAGELRRPAGAVRARKDIARERFLKLPIPRPRQKRRDRRPAGRKTLRRSAASASARQDRRRPSRADCRRDRCKTRRKASARCRARHLPSRPSRASTSTRCSTIRSNRPSTVSGTP